MNKKSGLSLKKIINNDKSLIVVVLILAVIIWTITSLNIGTDETRTINIKVPITLSDQLSKQVGMKYYTLKDTVDLKVTISGAKYIIGQVDENDLNIKFDTSNVNRAGEQSLPILVTNKSKSMEFTITNTYPSSIDAYFDVEETKTFDIKLKYDENAVADGYIFGTPLLSEEKVVISGPTTYVDKINGVNVEADFGTDSLTESYAAELPLNLKGSGIEQSYLNITSKTDNSVELNSVAVTVPVLKKTVLPVSVDLENVPEGITTKDYSISYSVKQIEAGVIENADVKSAVVGKIDFSELTIGKNVFTFSLTNAQGFTSLSKSVRSVRVIVNISSDNFEKKIVATNLDNIKLIEGGGDEEINSINKSTLILITRKGTKVSSGDISMSSDISEKTDDNKYRVNFDISTPSTWVYGKYYINLK